MQMYRNKKCGTIVMMQNCDTSNRMHVLTMPMLYSNVYTSGTTWVTTSESDTVNTYMTTSGGIIVTGHCLKAITKQQAKIRNQSCDLLHLTV